MSYIIEHMKESIEILKQIDADIIEKMVDILVGVRLNKGRLFILGVGGSAANALMQ